MKTNSEITKTALEQLEGRWGNIIGAFIVSSLISVASQFIPFLGGIASIIIAGPISLGLTIYTLQFIRQKEVDFNTIFEGFNDFARALGGYLLMVVFIFLWSLLLIIPGIIAALSYSQVFYILAEDKNIQPMDALRKSKEMMDGYKTTYFLLALRFFGWALLCILTLGIGFIFLYPYAAVSYANFYKELRGDEFDGNNPEDSIIDSLIIE